MAKPGEKIEASSIGETIIFLQTEKGTNGDFVQAERILKPRSGFIREHYHLNQGTRTEVISGKAAYKLNGVNMVATSGEVVIIPPKAKHIDPWNNSDEELRMLIEARPAQGVEVLFETWYGLARDHRHITKKGQLNLLQIALTIHSIPLTAYILPKVVQDFFTPVSAFIARLFGYKPYYPEYSDPADYPWMEK